MSERLSERVSLRTSEAIKHFERANQRYGAEGSLVRRPTTLDDLLHSGMVHQ